MSKRTILSTLITLTTLTLTTGCSLFNSIPVVKANPSDGVSQTHKAPAKQTTEPAPVQQVSREPEKQTTHVTATPAHPNPQETASKIASHLQGRWYIVTVNKDNIASEDDQPYIQFVEGDHKIYASDGCNVINGMYSLSGDNNLTFRNVLSTLRACPDIKYPQQIGLILKSGTTVKATFEHKDNHKFMILTALSGVGKLVLRLDNLQDIAGEWRIAKIDGHDIVEDAGMNIFFNTDDMTVHGNSGCNYFNGEIYVDATKPTSISFSHMAVTQRMCPNAEWETKMLVALEQTVAFSHSGKNSLHLIDRKGHTIIVLHK